MGVILTEPFFRVNHSSKSFFCDCLVQFSPLRGHGFEIFFCFFGGNCPAGPVGLLYYYPAFFEHPVALFPDLLIRVANELAVGTGVFQPVSW